jgi:hypothetical protein
MLVVTRPLGVPTRMALIAAGASDVFVEPVGQVEVLVRSNALVNYHRRLLESAPLGLGPRAPFRDASDREERSAHLRWLTALALHLPLHHAVAAASGVPGRTARVALDEARHVATADEIVRVVDAFAEMLEPATVGTIAGATRLLQELRSAAHEGWSPRVLTALRAVLCCGFGPPPAL